MNLHPVTEVTHRAHPPGSGEEVIDDQLRKGHANSLAC
jgi:hypothetical protein